MTKKTWSENTLMTPNVIGVPSGRWAILLRAEIPRLTVVTISKSSANKGCSAHLDAWVQCLVQGTSYHSEGTRRSAPGLLEWIGCCTGHLTPPAGTPAQPSEYFMSLLLSHPTTPCFCCSVRKKHAIGFLVNKIHVINKHHEYILVFQSDTLG